MATDVDRRVRDAMAGLTLEQKVGQLFVTHVYGADAERPSSEAAAGNRAELGCDAAADVVRRYHVGGVVYFGWAGNLTSPAQMARLSNGLQRAAIGDGDGVPLVVAVGPGDDGAVAALRPPFTELPGNLALGASGNGTNVEHAGALGGRELRAVGVNQCYAPDVRVAAFGERLAVAQLRGLRDAGLITTAVRFPVTGDDTLFRAVVEAGVDAVVCSHIVVPAFDPGGVLATRSGPDLTGPLREELGFDGVIVTDSLAIQGVRAKYGDDRVPVLALLAGADQLLTPPNLGLAYRVVLDAVRTGELTEERVDRSVERILRMKFARGIAEHAIVDESAVDAVVGARRHRDSAQRITDRTITVVRDDDGNVPLSPTWQAVLVVGCGTDAAESLSEALAEHCGWTCAVDAGPAPGPDEVKVAVARAKHHDVVVVVTGRVPDGAGDAAAGRRRLVSALLATRTPVLLVTARDPRDVAHHPDAPTCLATYSENVTSMRSLARVLVGEVEPRGTLPVSVPGEDRRPTTGDEASVA